MPRLPASLPARCALPRRTPHKDRALSGSLMYSARLIATGPAPRPAASVLACSGSRLIAPTFGASARHRNVAPPPRHRPPHRRRPASGAAKHKRVLPARRGRTSPPSCRSPRSAWCGDPPPVGGHRNAGRPCTLPHSITTKQALSSWGNGKAQQLAAEPPHAHAQHLPGTEVIVKRGGPRKQRTEQVVI